MNVKAGLVLILAGVFVGAQILKGGALDRILSPSSSSSASGGGVPDLVPAPTINNIAGTNYTGLGGKTFAGLGGTYTGLSGLAGASPGALSQGIGAAAALNKQGFHL